MTGRLAPWMLDSYRKSEYNISRSHPSTGPALPLASVSYEALRV